MAKYNVTLKRELKENKEGLIGGGIFGFIIASLLKREGVQTLMAAGETGLIDYVVPNLPAADIATAKFYFAAILLGMVIGYLVDKYTKFI